jgi:hypothetical protein
VKAIGVSKWCCLVCAYLLLLLCLLFGYSIEFLGSHAQIKPCALPPWLPQDVVAEVVLKFASDLRKILSQLGGVSRRRTDSITSVDTAPPSEDEGTNKEYSRIVEDLEKMEAGQRAGKKRRRKRVVGPGR